MASSTSSSPSDLVSLVTSTTNSTVFPSDDAILSVLQARFRSDLHYTRLGASTLVVVNPLRTLANLNDASAESYQKECYSEASWEEQRAPHPEEALPPHPYELALRVYHSMRRTSSSQAIIYSGATDSGKTFTSKLVTAQLLRLSCSTTKREQKLSEQIHAFETILNSFGAAKTIQNSNASRYSRYSELHFTSEGKLAAAKILTFGLDKGRLCLPLATEERSFHVFYQLLAGATHEEREALRLEDVTSYALLASSGCYRLPGGPSSDDSIAMEELRASMKVLGFKQKQTSAIFSLLSAILLLGNLEFAGPSGNESASEAATVLNTTVLEEIAELLGVAADDLEQSLTTRSRFVRKEIVSSLLSPAAASAQRDNLARDLYATLFAFVVETANHKIAPAADEKLPTQIVQLDTPGFQSKSNSNSMGSSLAHGSSPSSHQEFASNFVSETLQNWIERRAFDNDVSPNVQIIADGVTLPEVITGDNTACVELLRGSANVGDGAIADRKPAGLLGSLDKIAHRIRSGKVAEDDEGTLLTELDSHTVHGSYVASFSQVSQQQQRTGVAGPPRRVFGVNHYQGSCSYDAASFASKEIDVFDSNFVQLLRMSQAGFIAKLFAGPSLSTEIHPLDKNVVVSAQVSVRPLRRPNPLSPAAPPCDPLLDPQKPYGITRQLNSTLAEILSALGHAANVWTILCLRPNDIDQPNSFDAKRVKAQIRSLLLTDLVARKRSEYVHGTTFEEFCTRHRTGVNQAAAAVGVSDPREKVQAFAIANAWRESLDFAMGRDKVWLAYGVWRRLEDRLRAVEPPENSLISGAAEPGVSSESPTYPPGRLGERSASYLLGPGGDGDLGRSPGYGESEELLPRQSTASNPFFTPGAESVKGASEPGWANDWAESKNDVNNKAYGDVVNPAMNGVGVLEKDGGLDGRGIDQMEEEPTTTTRRWWIRFTWLLTWWIPTFCLSRCGGMKRPDVQMAWREKIAICMLIFFACGFILFYILAFGRIICPDQDKAWNKSQLSQHGGTDDYFVAVRGKVYDLTKFWKNQHSDSTSQVSSDVMLQLAGQDLTPYFPIPLTVGCPGLVTDTTVELQTNSSSTDYTASITQAVHKTGAQADDQSSKLADINWYPDRFVPFMNKHYKGYYVTSKGDVEKQSSDKSWAIVDDHIYDLSNYVWTNQLSVDDSTTKFLPSDVTDLFTSQPGQDISSDFHSAMNGLNTTMQRATQNCLDNMFYAGRTDFRETARCQVQNYLLLAFSCILVATILAKFLAALQLAPKRNPEQQDKFVICQVPCYTEGEDELRKTIDSLAGLQYDDKRKLMFLICDGMIVGSGNEQPTPRIILDILGVDPKIDPEPLMFKSVADGSKQLNYGKVYSGLYEFEGHVVPYIVVVKVGRPSERSRPGNRGKRDTQILLMRYLNRVHFDAPMYPLELEIYHQMKNVIGIDPAFYEYVLMVDADTSVEPDGLNRLVAVAADDSRVIALCGETKLDNEEGSWWTMIQVYEYYISHHLAKAFESLFGSVTCLPGCFSMYRIRSADKGRPLFISNRVIDDYSENKVDTLHKKNLLALGEDRYLTTLILKHFPAFRTKFTPDAHAHTNAPDRWGILLSQRRRWINSTIHNLAELVMMPELCGFCLFSMRFIVFIDLLGTIILPATTVYLVYLIVTVSTHKAAIPYISIAMIAAVYGLQMVIFLLKRQWQYMGWLLIYLLAYPVWSFFLPIYSFWHMDDFSWGNTRIVVGEKGNKKIVAGTDDEPYDDSMIPLKKFSEYQRDVWMQPDAMSIHSGLSGSASVVGPFGNVNAVSYPQIPGPGSQYAGSNPGSDYGGDYFQNTNVLDKSRPHSRQSSANALGSMSRMPSMGFGPQQSPSMGAMTMTGHPSMYAMPPAPVTSMYGMPLGSSSMYMGGGGAPSLYGMPPMAAGHSPSPSGSDVGIGAAQRSSTMPLAQQMTGTWGSSPALPRPQSTMTQLGGNGTNPFAPPPGAAPANGLETNLNPNPTDEDLVNAVRTHLAAQTDLMQVSKRSVREAVIAAFPKATDLGSRKARINQAIDDTLSGAA